VIGVGCAYMLARSLVAVQKGQAKVGKLYSWMIRTVLCMAAVWYPLRASIDMADLVVWSVGVVAFAVGFWEASHIKKQEDLTHEIFPDSDRD